MDGLLYLGVAALGVGLIVLGAALGLGQIGAQALDGISRQPSNKSSLFAYALVFMGMLEAVSLFGLVIIFVKIN